MFTILCQLLKLVMKWYSTYYSQGKFSSELSYGIRHLSSALIKICFLRGGVLVEKLFCSFFNPVISLYIYYDQYEKILRKHTQKFTRLVSMEMAAIFDFRALTKVHIL